MLLNFYFFLILLLAYWANSWSVPAYLPRRSPLDGLRWTAQIITFSTFVASRYLKRLFKVRS